MSFVIKCELCEVETSINSYNDLVHETNDIEIIETLNHGIIIECSCGNRIGQFGGVKDE